MKSYAQISYVKSCVNRITNFILKCLTKLSVFFCHEFELNFHETQYFYSKSPRPVASAHDMSLWGMIDMPDADFKSIIQYKSYW